MNDVLQSSELGTLATLVEEVARSTQAGVKRFVEPGPGTLRRATLKRHHIVFGRRGSGKTSLLRKGQVDLTRDGRPTASRPNWLPKIVGDAAAYRSEPPVV